MKKIAVLTCGDIYDRKGLFNAVHNRIKHLTLITNLEIDVIIFSEYIPWYLRLIKQRYKNDKLNILEVEGVIYNIKWRCFSLLDYISEIKFKKRYLLKRIYFKNIAKAFSGYNFIISHSDCGFIALEIKKRYNIPFSVTWHGSDIHTRPFVNSYIKQQTKLVIENANYNYFVSKALLDCSNQITTLGNKDVLYNGCDGIFVRYDEGKRNQMRKILNVTNKKVVTFCGDFYEVKNILIIPEIFRKIYEQDHDVIFWMIGDGTYRSKIEKLIVNLPVILWGNQLADRIPDFFNSTDVLILPSKNEGLPLVTVEALKCGCHVVGSKIGGIPEVIGVENCISLESETFVDDFAHKVCYYLQEGSSSVHTVNTCFDWRSTAKKELKHILKSIN